LEPTLITAIKLARELGEAFKSAFGKGPIEEFGGDMKKALDELRDMNAIISGKGTAREKAKGIFGVLFPSKGTVPGTIADIAHEPTAAQIRAGQIKGVLADIEDARARGEEATRARIAAKDLSLPGPQQIFPKLAEGINELMGKFGAAMAGPGGFLEREKAKFPGLTIRTPEEVRAMQRPPSRMFADPADFAREAITGVLSEGGPQKEQIKLLEDARTELREIKNQVTDQAKQLARLLGIPVKPRG
jgi:hypothetical protein